MIPTVSLRTNDFTLAGTGDLAARRPGWPIAWSPGGSQGAVNGYGFAPAPFPSNCSKHQFSQQSRTGAASFRLQWPNLPRTVAMTEAIIMKARACRWWTHRRSKRDPYTFALPSRVPMTPTKPGRFHSEQRPLDWLVFLKPTRTTVVARSILAILSVFSGPFNACHSTKKRSARPHAR